MCVVHVHAYAFVSFSVCVIVCVYCKLYVFCCAVLCVQVDFVNLLFSRCPWFAVSVVCIDRQASLMQQIDNPQPHGGCNMIRNVLSCECAFIDIIICQTQGGRAREEKKWERNRTAQRKRQILRQLVIKWDRMSTSKNKNPFSYTERRNDKDSQTAGAIDRKRQMGDIKSKLSNHRLLLYLTQIC